MLITSTFLCRFHTTDTEMRNLNTLTTNDAARLPNTPITRTQLSLLPSPAQCWCLKKFFFLAAKQNFKIFCEATAMFPANASYIPSLVISLNWNNEIALHRIIIKYSWEHHC